MSKRPIRDDLLARRRHLSVETCLGKSLTAQRRLFLTPEFAAAAVVGLYSSVHNEVFTEEIFSTARGLGKTVAYPRIRGDVLDFVEVKDLRDLEAGAFSILEPGEGTIFSPKELEMIVVPGVAFDLFGHRLGYGKGYYDRCLHESPGRLVGLCFEFQIMNKLPAESHDVRMNMIVTEERTLRIAAADSAEICSAK